MRIFGITRPGLIAISIAVAALWGCIAAGSLLRNRAAVQHRALLREMRQNQRNIEPAHVPAEAFGHRASALIS